MSEEKIEIRIYRKIEEMVFSRQGATLLFHQIRKSRY